MSVKNKKKWLMSGAVGAILTGTGFSLAVEASHWKHSGEPFWLWVLSGTLGIAILMAGIIVLIKTGLMEQKDNE